MQSTGLSVAFADSAAREPAETDNRYRSDMVAAKALTQVTIVSASALDDKSMSAHYFEQQNAYRAH